jgi:hypothetical protein
VLLGLPMHVFFLQGGVQSTHSSSTATTPTSKKSPRLDTCAHQLTNTIRRKPERRTDLWRWSVPAFSRLVHTLLQLASSRSHSGASRSQVVRTVVLLLSTLLASPPLDLFPSFSYELQPWVDCNERAQTQVNHNHNHTDFQKKMQPNKYTLN